MSTSSSFDTNVNNYTTSELLAILGLTSEDASPNAIVQNSNEYIQKYKTSNPPISSFFQDIQSQLLQYSSDLQNQENTQDAEQPATQQQTSNWYQNEALTQNNPTQDNKVTTRQQQIDVYGNEHVPMNRKQLGINNNFTVPIAQDSLNPNLENVISRFMNLDSQFRQSGNTIENSSSDYTLDLSDYLPNVLSMRLYSYQIPYSWYTIDTAYGNTCFWITNGENVNIPITISPGNYEANDFVSQLNEHFTNAGFTFPDTTPVNTPVTYNIYNGKITLQLMGGLFAGNHEYAAFTISESTVITFFDYTTKLMCQNSDSCANKGFYINQTLGWLMGFRVPYLNVVITGNVAPAILDLIGTKYIILVIDDYNQNHINNGLVSITELSNTLKVPSYYNADLPYVCTKSTKNASALEKYYQTDSGSSDVGLLIADKLNPGYIKYPQVLPSAPRILTQSQIYTINEIIKNNDKTTNYRSKAPTTNDVFAILPVKTSGLSTGSLIVEFSGSLQDNKRTYFGPVNLERLRVKLLDDKGNVLNMNGADWCITIICECLYQY